MNTPSTYLAIKKLRSLLTREEKINWLLLVGFAITVSLFEVITASVVVIFAQVLNNPEDGLKYLTKLGFNSSGIRHGEIILYSAITVGVVYLFKNIIAAIEVYYQNYSIQRMNYNFKNNLLHRYAESNYSSHISRNSSFNVSIVTGDVEQMFSSGMVCLAGILSEGTIFIFLVSMIIFMNPYIAIFIFGVGAIIILCVSRWLLPLFYKWGQSWQEAGVYSNQNLLQFFHGFKEIILLGKKEAFIEAFHIHSFKRSQIQAVQGVSNSIPRMVIEVLFVELFILAVAFFCLTNESTTQMIGVMGGYLYAGFRLMPGMNRIINQLNSFKSTIPSIERVYTEFWSKPHIETYANIPDFSFSNAISFQGVSYCYPSTSSEVLSGLSLEIQKGEHIGIIGETGSGKSTLVDLILGLLRPTEGSILIDGTHTVSSHQWHANIGYVPQSIYLIDDTIKANIAFGEKDFEIDYNRLSRAIDDSQLRKFIEKLPTGLDTVVGERGMRLSGGERQRIGIARAIYRNPEVLIFDEATSALDNETELRLMDTIRAISQSRTVIMIAHRLSTLKDCDRIIELSNGQLKRVLDPDLLAL